MTINGVSLVVFTTLCTVQLLDEGHAPFEDCNLWIGRHQDWTHDEEHC